MTSQKDQIQALIAEIDGVLQRANPRLPWVMSGEVTQQRQVLERVRNYLVSLQQQTLSKSYGVAPGADFLSQDLYYQPSQDPTRSPAFETDTSANQTTQQMLERVLQEIAQLRVSLVPPNQPPLSAELLQVLINRLQERLSQQISQALQPTGGQTYPPRSDYMLASGATAALSTSQYEQVQALRTRSDQMLVNLDSTINIVFESLQRNIQTYQDSLSQGLDRMYSLGQQSEVTFKALVELLIKQLQQEVETLPVSPAPQPLPAPSPAIPSFPYAGSEVLSTDFTQAELTAPTRPASQRSPQAEPQINDAVSAWLSLAGAQNQLVKPAPELGSDQSSIPDLDLSNLDLDAPKSAVPSPVPPARAVAADPPAISASDDEDTTEIDAALKLLENLSAELQTASSPLSLEEAEDQLNDLLQDTPGSETDALLLPEIPQEIHTELDEFYQSLFGEAEPVTAAKLPPIPTAKPVSEKLPAIEPLTADWDISIPEEAPQTTDSAELSAGLESFVTEPASTVAPDSELLAATEEVFLHNLFEEAPTLPPVPSSERLLGDFIDLGDSPTKPDFESSTPTIAPETVRFTQSDQISSLTDLFATVQVEHERSAPVEPPAAPPSTPHQATASLIDVPFEQTYSELLQREISQPIEQPYLQDQEFGVADDFLEEEQYTRAAFDENLLPDAPVEVMDLSLDVDEMTLSSLNEDLASLESLDVASQYGDGSQAAIAQSNTPFRSASGFTLGEFAADLPHDSQPVDETNVLSLEDFASAIANTPATPSADSEDLFASFTEPAPSATEPFSEDDNSAFTLEGMDDLFEDAPAIHPPTNSRSVTARGNAPIKEIPPFKPQSSNPSDLGLDEAFESIVGSIPATPSTEETQSTPQTGAEKKKT